jgi:hypothetical protein
MASEPTSQKTVESSQAAAGLANALNSIAENSEEDATSAANEINPAILGSQSSTVNDQEKDALRQEVLKLQEELHLNQQQVQTLNNIKQNLGAEVEHKRQEGLKYKEQLEQLKNSEEAVQLRDELKQQAENML